MGASTGVGLSGLRRGVGAGVQAVSAALVPAKFRQAVHRRLSPRHKYFLDELFSPGCHERGRRLESAANDLSSMRLHLYRHGFVDRALAELQKMYAATGETDVRANIAWEMAIWHAGQENSENVREALRWLARIPRGTASADRQRELLLVAAECRRLAGEIEGMREELARTAAAHPHPDLYLAAANLARDDAERLGWINRMLQAMGLMTLAPDACIAEAGGMSFDRLASGIPGPTDQRPPDAPLVTVIVPVFNAQQTIDCALRSLRAQTWRALEILVVDDGSTDATARHVQSHAACDSRIRLLATARNSGAYTARNHALLQAGGDYVTCHDADDWAHPEKIERQVRHLERHPDAVAGFSHMARANDALRFYLPMTSGTFIKENMSSLMFRRRPVLDRIGFWDCVRFGGDAEFINRLTAAFGDEALLRLPPLVLTVARKRDDSLTGAHPFGMSSGYLAGARAEYKESALTYIEAGGCLRFAYPEPFRRFPVPEPMLPARRKRSDPRIHFDVLLASDFRLPFEATCANAREIRMQARLGLRTGLVQMPRYDPANAQSSIQPGIRDQMDGWRTQMVVHGQSVTCDLLVLRDPRVLDEWQRYMPEIEARDVRIVLDHFPSASGHDQAGIQSLIHRRERNFRRHFGCAPVWAPASALLRSAWQPAGHPWVSLEALAEEDWMDGVDLATLRFRVGPNAWENPRIGICAGDTGTVPPLDPLGLLDREPELRHASVDLFAACPDALVRRRYMPGPWRWFPVSASRHPGVLSALDFLVCVPWATPAGMIPHAVLCAMAAGVPVLLAPEYQHVFGEAACYIEPGGLRSAVLGLQNDDDRRRAMVRIARKFVETHCSPACHEIRLRNIGVTLRDDRDGNGSSGRTTS